MSQQNNLKEKLYRWKLRAKWEAAFRIRKIRRSLIDQKLTLEGSFKVPIVINSFNRLTYLEQLVNWLTENGYSNLFILDNRSDYAPLLEYYKTVNAKVIFLDRNYGYKALWLSGHFDQFKNNYYVYTDPDVLPSPGCPSDVVFRLYEVLTTYPDIEKCGPALNIEDLPYHYEGKNAVITDEKKYWRIELGKDVYDAPVDTTFALYRAFAFGNAEECKGCRVGGVYTFRHMPWYEDSSHPSDETMHYKRTIATGTSVWSSRNE
jgi:hypothetical protein